MVKREANADLTLMAPCATIQLEVVYRRH